MIEGKVKLYSNLGTHIKIKGQQLVLSALRKRRKVQKRLAKSR